MNTTGIKRSMMTKQSSLEDPLDLEADDNDNGSNEEEFEDASNTTGSNEAAADAAADAAAIEGGFGRDSPRPGSPMPNPKKDTNRSLPWIPKVRHKDLEQFLNENRNKFIGYTLENDSTTLAGLPKPIHEGVAILKKHMYKSLAEVQVEVRR